MIIHQKNKLKIKNKIFSYKTLFSNFKCNEYIAFDYVLINICRFILFFFFILFYLILSFRFMFIIISNQKFNNKIE